MASKRTLNVPPDAPERLELGQVDGIRGDGGPPDGGSTAVPVPPALADVSDEAARSFRDRYPEVGFAPVVVIIPAFNEEECIGAVLPAVPREAFGLEVDTLVVDDGSSDGTSAAALANGVYVAKLSRNSGQGTALRVGYRLAREHGARFIVTLDADGQWDPAEMLRVLEPVVNDEADLVLGSRILGRAETDDSVRRAGVHVFARILRLLTGVPITDTSSGVRAMRAEVTATVRQVEPQYQASELLVGAIYQGYRTAERPRRHAQAARGEEQEGTQLLLRTALWPGGAPDVVAREPIGQARGPLSSARRAATRKS